MSYPKLLDKTYEINPVEELDSRELTLAGHLDDLMNGIGQLVAESNMSHQEVTGINIKRSSRGVFVSMTTKRSLYLRTR